jgi:pheromone shutdown protein TraB
MNWGIWVILWIFAAIPIVTIAKRREKKDYEEIPPLARALGKIIFTVLVAACCLSLCVPDGQMWWILIGCAMFGTMLEVCLAKFSTTVKVASVVVFCAFLIAGIVVAAFAGLNNAIYFESFVEKKEGFPIHTEVPDNLLRLTTDHLARYIALQYMGELGGAVKITDMQLTFYEGRLV